MQRFAFAVGGSVGTGVGVEVGPGFVCAGTTTVIPMEADEVPADAATGAKTKAKAAAARAIFLVWFVIVVPFGCVVPGAAANGEARSVLDDPLQESRGELHGLGSWRRWLLYCCYCRIRTAMTSMNSAASLTCGARSSRFSKGCGRNHEAGLRSFLNGSRLILIEVVQHRLEQHAESPRSLAMTGSTRRCVRPVKTTCAPRSARPAAQASPIPTVDPRRPPFCREDRVLTCSSERVTVPERSHFSKSPK
jgi:hypothetical protein